ncbi:hypothetical protein BBJ28_00011470 [Nothophytophthora sp. Chile5]|nr:hypothetical protein BBJ28_00011470 [Nothophytophthora sp. Chile5]
MTSTSQRSKAAAAACLAVLAALPGTIATPFAYNPFTTNECATSSLSHSSPAFGGIAPGLDIANITYGELSYLITNASVATSTEQTFTSYGSETTTSNAEQVSMRKRTLEESNTDLQKLEQFFGSSMEVNVKNLASTAAYYVLPWPSSYWAVYQDGINYQWSSNGEPSASEKYATAFGLDATAFMTTISESTGILSEKSLRSSCSSDSDCSSLNDGSACAIRTGEQQGYCIPTWFGICHAWAPAALLEPEPRCAVEKNGVTFQPMDIKALLSEVYDGANLGTVFTGVRFYGSDSDATTDQYGRYTDSSRRDIGPGFLHVALANVLGRFNSSVVVDVTGGAEVWNQPVYSYEVLTQTELTPTEAATQYYGQSVYPFNSAAERIMYTETSITWMVEAYEDGGLVASGKAESYTKSDTYTYLLELDNDYNILGGEWVGDSNADHPDFLWLPKARPDLSTVTDVGLSYQNVRDLLDQAANCA